MSDNLSALLDDRRNQLVDYAQQIIKRAMTRLHWKYVDIIYTEVEVLNFAELKFLARYISQVCGRVVVLTLRGEDTHLVISKSGNITHLYVNEIVQEIAQTYGGTASGDEMFATLTSHRPDFIPEMIDMAVQSVIVAIPSPMS